MSKFQPFAAAFMEQLNPKIIFSICYNFGYKPCFFSLTFI